MARKTSNIPSSAYGLGIALATGIGAAILFGDGVPDPQLTLQEQATGNLRASQDASTRYAIQDNSVGYDNIEQSGPFILRRSQGTPTHFELYSTGSREILANYSDGEGDHIGYVTLMGPGYGEDLDGILSGFSQVPTRVKDKLSEMANGD